MLTNTQIKARARTTLGGKIFGERWMAGVLIIFIFTVITSAAGVIPFASLLISGPLSVGVAGAFLYVMRTGEKAKTEDMFAGFKDFGKNFVLGLLISLFTVLWSLLFIVPGIIKGLSYSMAYYIKNDHPEYDWKQCIEESKKMTYGHKGQLFCLYLSFIGWYFLGALCLGIGTLWVTPYVSASTAEFYIQLRGKDMFEGSHTATLDEETLSL